MIRAIVLSLTLMTTNLNAECVSENKRFKDIGNGTVLDIETSLTWMKCAFGMIWRNSMCIGQSTRMEWQKATFATNQFNEDGFAGYKNWRLPTQKELESIVEKHCFQPAINESKFPNTVSTGFWTSTENPTSKYHAMLVFFLHGESYLSNKQAEWFVRLVRD